MNELRIPIHSVIDITTNNSTEIFTQASTNTIIIIKEIIMDLDMSIDVDKSFNFELVKDKNDIYPYLFDYYSEELTYFDDPNEFNKMSLNEQQSFIKLEIEYQKNGTEIKWIDEAMEYFNRNIILEITAIDNKGKILLPLINKIMSITKTVKNYL